MKSDVKLIPVREAHRFEEDRLAEYLKDNLAEFKGPLRIEQFEGGQSNPTFLLSTDDKKYVLRKKPPGKLLPSAHMVEREYRIMKALENPMFRFRSCIFCVRTKVSSVPRFL